MVSFKETIMEILFKNNITDIVQISDYIIEIDTISFNLKNQYYIDKNNSHSGHGVKNFLMYYKIKKHNGLILQSLKEISCNLAYLEKTLDTVSKMQMNEQRQKIGYIIKLIDNINL